MKAPEVALYHRPPWEVRCYEDGCEWEAEAWTKRAALALKAQHGRGECARQVNCPDCGHAAADHANRQLDRYGCRGAGWTDASCSDLECECEWDVDDVMTGSAQND